LVYLDDIVVFTRGGVERHVLELAWGWAYAKVEEVRVRDPIDGIPGPRTE
jgi:hypothetical protein